MQQEFFDTKGNLKCKFNQITFFKENITRFSRFNFFRLGMSTFIKENFDRNASSLMDTKKFCFFKVAQKFVMNMYSEVYTYFELYFSYS